MSSLPPDPVLCCAARVCCGGLKARQATAKILEGMGLNRDQAAKVSEAMEARDIVFMPRTVSLAMRDLVSSSHEFQQGKGGDGGNGKDFGGIDV